MKAFEEHRGKVIVADKRYKHVMALALDPASGNKRGLLRCIVSRQGNVAKSGFVDRSELHLVNQTEDGRFEIGEKLRIHGEADIIASLQDAYTEFIGLEDPDIFVDETSGLTHVYFTMPYKHTKEHWALVHLGHASGKDLDSLEMTEPVLLGDKKTHIGAKELSVAPVNEKRFRYNLVESSQKEKDFWYSTVKVAIAHDMGKSWQYGDTIFHPKQSAIPWIGGHASPGPLVPRSFIDVGEGKLLGIMNGREANQRVGKEIRYGMFSIGLCIYDYQNGKIDWVSPKPLIVDSEARTITFASQFVEMNEDEGILYAHVDDSFVRAYTLYSAGLAEILP